MTFSVDDLVASFSSSHVGQEAMDLATLQAQLAQTLAAQQQYQQQQHASQAHCNTPTARTPTMSFANWGAAGEPAARRSRSTSLTMGARRGTHGVQHDSDTIIEENMDEDDELAVEQLVGEPALGSMRTAPNQSQSQWAADGSSFSGYSGHQFGEQATLSSSFAASDPFYAAVEASCQQVHQPHPGFFAQMARPAQQSPFYAAQASSGFDPLTHAHTHTMDPRARLVTTGTVDA